MNFHMIARSYQKIAGKDMPRVAFILECYYGDSVGGAERQVQLLAGGLREHGWQTTYICEREQDKPRKENLEEMEILALPVRKRRSAWLNYNALKTHMAGSQADIFYQRIRHPYTGCAAFIARRMGKPFVFACASKADVVRQEDLRMDNFYSPRDVILHPLCRVIEDWGILNADARILQTEEQLRLLERNYKRSGTVIPNHIVINDETRYPLKFPPEILWISNLKSIKRPELFLELARRCRDIEANFIIAGAAQDKSYLPKTRNAEKELPNLAYIGALNPVECEERIAKATLLVNTSKFEGFPNTFLHAWANGIPVLSLGVDPDGIIARRGFGKCGETLDELESHLRRFLQGEVERREIGERARDFVRNHYTLQLLLPRYVSLFNNLLKV